MQQRNAWQLICTGHPAIAIRQVEHEAWTLPDPNWKMTTDHLEVHACELHVGTHDVVQDTFATDQAITVGNAIERSTTRNVPKEQIAANFERWVANLQPHQVLLPLQWMQDLHVVVHKLAVEQANTDDQRVFAPYALKPMLSTREVQPLRPGPQLPSQGEVVCVGAFGTPRRGRRESWPKAVKQYNPL